MNNTTRRVIYDRCARIAAWRRSSKSFGCEWNPAGPEVQRRHSCRLRRKRGSLKDRSITKLYHDAAESPAGAKSTSGVLTLGSMMKNARTSLRGISREVTNRSRPDPTVSESPRTRERHMYPGASATPEPPPLARARVLAATAVARASPRAAEPRPLISGRVIAGYRM